MKIVKIILLSCFIITCAGSLFLTSSFTRHSMLRTKMLVVGRSAGGTIVHTCKKIDYDYSPRFPPKKKEVSTIFKIYSLS